MLLSIIIVSFNEKDYLEEAINSCLQQEMAGKFEIIIGDDGSSDGSIDIINRYTLLYPNIIKSFVMERHNETNIIGSIRASNVIRRGLDIAKGKYVSVLSGDDYFCDKYKFNKQIMILEQDINEKYSAVACDFKRVYEKGKEEFCNICSMPFNYFWSGCYLHISCFLFRRNILKKEVLLKNFCDDCGLHYSIGLAGKIFHIPEVMFAYRQRSGSIMSKSDIMELHLLECLLFKDILEKKSYILSSIVRFRKSIRYLYNNRELLDDDKYIKYIDLLSSNHNILEKLIKLNIFEYMLLNISMEILSLYYRVSRKILKL